MKHYYGIIDGIEGVGKSLTKNGSVEINENISDKETFERRGGTFSNVYVSKKVREAIENSEQFENGFFGFRAVEGEPDKSEIFAKYPEMGRNSVTNENFCLRKNMNIFCKAFVKSFTDEYGNIDFIKSRYITETFEYAAFEDNDLKDPKKSKLLKLIYDNLELPEKEEDINDYKTFLENCAFNSEKNVTNKHSVITTNFFGVWQRGLENLYGSMKYLEEIEQSKDILTKEEALFKKECEKTIKNFNRDISEILNSDPEKEERMLILTECSGSQEINTGLHFWQNNYNNYKTGKENILDTDKYTVYNNVALENALGKYKAAKKEYDENYKKTSEIISKVEEKIEELKGADESNIYLENYLDRVKKYQNEIKDNLDSCEDFLTKNNIDVPGKNANPNNQLSWSFHRAFQGGKFNIDGQEYTITIEGFAPEAHALTDHSGVSFSGVNIGVYKDEADFQNFYLSDGIQTHFNFDHKKFLELKKEINDKLFKAYVPINKNINSYKESIQNNLDNTVGKRVMLEKELAEFTEKYKKDLGKEEEFLKSLNDKIDKEIDKFRKKTEKGLKDAIKEEETKLIKNSIPPEYIKKYGIKSLADLAEMGTDKGKGKKLTPGERIGFGEMAIRFNEKIENWKKEQIDNAVSKNKGKIEEEIRQKNKKTLDIYRERKSMQDNISSLKGVEEFLKGQIEKAFDIVTKDMQKVKKISLTSLDSNSGKSVSNQLTQPTKSKTNSLEPNQIKK